MKVPETYFRQAFRLCWLERTEIKESQVITGSWKIFSEFWSRLLHRFSGFRFDSTMCLEVGVFLETFCALSVRHRLLHQWRQHWVTRLKRFHRRRHSISNIHQSIMLSVFKNCGTLHQKSSHYEHEAQRFNIKVLIHQLRRGVLRLLPTNPHDIYRHNNGTINYSSCVVTFCLLSSSNVFRSDRKSVV